LRKRGNKIKTQRGGGPRPVELCPGTTRKLSCKQKGSEGEASLLKGQKKKITEDVWEVL